MPETQINDGRVLLLFSPPPRWFFDFFCFLCLLFRFVCFLFCLVLSFLALVLITLNTCSFSPCCLHETGLGSGKLEGAWKTTVAERAVGSAETRNERSQDGEPLRPICPFLAPKYRSSCDDVNTERRQEQLNAREQESVAWTRTSAGQCAVRNAVAGPVAGFVFQDEAEAFERRCQRIRIGGGGGGGGGGGVGGSGSIARSQVNGRNGDGGETTESACFVQLGLRSRPASR